MDNLIKDITDEIVKVFEPLIQAVKPERAPYVIYFFLQDAGIIKGLDDLPDRIDLLTTHLSRIAQAIPSIQGGSLTSPAAVEGFSTIADAIREMDGYGEMQSGEIQIEKVGEHLVKYLFIRYTTYYRPRLFTLSLFIGIIKEVKTSDDVTLKTFDINPLFQLLTDPQRWFENEFNWGREPFYSLSLMARLKLVLEQFSILSYTSYLGEGAQGTTDEEKLQLNIPFFHYKENNSDIIETGLSIRTVKRGPKPDGLRIAAYGVTKLGRSMSLSNDWEVKFNTSQELSAPIYLDLFPEKIQAGGGRGKLKFDLYFGKRLTGNRTILLGDQGTTRLETGPFGVKTSASVSQKSDISLEFITNGGKLIIVPGDGDNFIQKLLPSHALNIDFAPIISWSYLDGFHFNGSAGLENVFPIQKKIGPVSLKTLSLKLFLGINQPSTFETSISLSANLGPLKITLAGLGLKVGMETKRGGNLGFLDVAGPSFKGPNTIGASLNTNLISGGGFLHRREDGYDGILALNMRALELTGIAIITTRMPNGRKGFSMLISINAIFWPPFQLSFGFTIAGVGGLVGIHRTLKIDPLRDRIADGAVNSIMFPEDPIENADRIISDLRVIFPPKEGHFIIAPFLRIGFGTPSIIELDLGVVLEFPFTGRIVLLGSLGIYLPVKDLAIVEIHIDIVGDFNFPEQYIRIEGRLRQSHILSIQLKGGFAFMLDWGKRPAFLFSLGGYHPRYKKPAQFPDIPRLGAYIDLAGIVRLSCEYYQAITSNSFQIGFRAFLKVSLLEVSLEGHYQFDALLQFNPFMFSVEQGLSVKIKFKGETLAGIACYFRLSGPAPWVAAGYAEITLLIFTLEVDFHIEWGERRRAPKTYERLPSLLKRVKDSLNEVANWTANLPVGFRAGEALRAKEDFAKDEMVLHPSGYLQIRQLALPFNFRIEKYGNSYVREVPEFSIDSSTIEIGGKRARERQHPLREIFARGYYEELNNSEKLSTPDFESFEAGLSFGEGDADFELGGEDMVSVTPRDHEIIRIVPDDEPDPDSDREYYYLPDDITHARILNQGLGKKVAPENPGQRYRFSDEAPSMETEEEFVVTSSDNQVPVVDIEGNTLVFDTYSRAKQFLKYNPTVQDRLSEFQIVSGRLWEKF